jgi:hypothetical protein
MLTWLISAIKRQRLAQQRNYQREVIYKLLQIEQPSGSARSRLT